MNRGFTLIETVLYLAISVVVLLALVELSLQLTSKYNDDRFRSQVYQASLESSERIRHEVRLASDINTGSSTFDSNDGVISLVRDDVNLNPVVIGVVLDGSQRRLALSYAGNSDVYITPSSVEVDRFYLTNRSNVSQKTQNIQYVLELSTYNPNNQRIPEVNNIVTSSVELIGL